MREHGIQGVVGLVVREHGINGAIFKVFYCSLTPADSRNTLVSLKFEF